MEVETGAMKKLNIPDWTAGEPMPASAKESLKDKVRSLRKNNGLQEDAEVENAFIEGLYPLVQNFSGKERIRLLRQAERTLMTDEHPERRGQKGQTEHAPTELNAVKDTLIAAISTLEGMHRTAAGLLEQALLDRVGNLEELARFMPYKRLPNGRREVRAVLILSCSSTGWYPLPESRDEVKCYDRPETPTLSNLCALLWAVVDIIDPSASPSQWDAKEGLAAQASSPGATQTQHKKEFLIDLGKLLWEAIGRPPGRTVLQDMAKLIFGDELSWNAQEAAKTLKEQEEFDLKKISPP